MTDIIPMYKGAGIKDPKDIPEEFRKSWFLYRDFNYLPRTWKSLAKQDQDLIKEHGLPPDED